jgi:signal transduction histidine kinase/CheY-like chemotaxis protein
MIAGLGLLGYLLNLPILQTVRPGYQGMSPLTALGLLAVAASLWCDSPGRGLSARVATWAAFTIALVALLLHAVVGADVLSPWLAHSVFGTPEPFSGRTSVAAALGIGLIAAALLSRHPRSALPDLFAGAALVLSGTALLGYAYGVGDLYNLPIFKSMAVHTAAALVILSLATLCAEPEHGIAGIVASEGVGGGATRRQLAFTLLPAVAGWILLKFIEAHGLGPAIAMALLVVITIVPLALLVLRDGQILDQLDVARNARAKILADASQTLERRLEEQAAELAVESGERAKAEAGMYRAQRMEAVGQLTGGIAHDFNNLLMAVRGNLELLGRRLPEDERAQRYFSNAVAATDKGAKVTGQLLAFSRSQRLTIRSTEIDPVLMSARALIGSSLGPNITIDFQLDAATTWVATDPDQLELAILNLAVNARDAMPAGGSLRVVSRTCDRRLAADDDLNPYVSISVVDTGEGMTPDVLSHAIEPFFTTKERGKGTGLGLAQVYGFVRQCGGDLRISSTPGEGTHIEILLRCAAPGLSDAASPSTSGRLAGDTARGRSVLVIDDDDAVRAVIVDALRGANFEVVEASDGPSGLALLDNLTPDAAVIDFLMPGMNGAEVARFAQVKRPGLPIIFVSGYSDTVALDGIAGAIVLRKPFDIDGLHRAVSSVLH